MNLGRMHPHAQLVLRMWGAGWWWGGRVVVVGGAFTYRGNVIQAFRSREKIRSQRGRGIELVQGSLERGASQINVRQFVFS